MQLVRSFVSLFYVFFFLWVEKKKNQSPLPEPRAQNLLSGWITESSCIWVLCLKYYDRSPLSAADSRFFMIGSRDDRVIIALGSVQCGPGSKYCSIFFLGLIFFLGQKECGSRPAVSSSSFTPRSVFFTVWITQKANNIYIVPLFKKNGISKNSWPFSRLPEGIIISIPGSLILTPSRGKSKLRAEGRKMRDPGNEIVRIVGCCQKTRKCWTFGGTWISSLNSLQCVDNVTNNYSHRYVNSTFCCLLGCARCTQ